MTIPAEYSFIRYLSSKKRIDDRALNRSVWKALENALPEQTSSSPLRVLEVGAGIGTMFERMLEWGLLTYAEYTAVESLPKNLLEAERRLLHWAPGQELDARSFRKRSCLMEGAARHYLLVFEPVNLFDYLQGIPNNRQWDLIVAHAFLDLVDLPSTIPRLFQVLRAGGIFYFSLNFDGLTILEPLIDSAFDSHVLALYHQTMDERRENDMVSGDSQTGRHLFAQLRRQGAHILEAGSSDWVVYPGRAGYQEDEAYFLHYIVHTIDMALRGHPEMESARFEAWISERHAQIERAELVYIAHQLDITGTRPT